MEYPLSSNPLPHSKVSSLQTDLDNSVAVQNDFVRLSQSLQVREGGDCWSLTSGTGGAGEDQTVRE